MGRTSIAIVAAQHLEGNCAVKKQGAGCKRFGTRCSKGRGGAWWRDANKKYCRHLDYNYKCAYCTSDNKFYSYHRMPSGGKQCECTKDWDQIEGYKMRKMRDRDA